MEISPDTDLSMVGPRIVKLPKPVPTGDAQFDKMTDLCAQAVQALYDKNAEVQALAIENARLFKSNQILGELLSELGRILQTSGNVVTIRAEGNEDPGEASSEIINLELSVRSSDCPRFRQMIEVARTFGAKAGNV